MSEQARIIVWLGAVICGNQSMAALSFPIDFSVPDYAEMIRSNVPKHKIAGIT
jgi:hypothetical protein